MRLSFRKKLLAHGFFTIAFNKKLKIGTGPDKRIWVNGVRPVATSMSNKHFPQTSPKISGSLMGTGSRNLFLWGGTFFKSGPAKCRKGSTTWILSFWRGWTNGQVPAFNPNIIFFVCLQTLELCEWQGGSGASTISVCKSKKKAGTY